MTAPALQERLLGDVGDLHDAGADDGWEAGSAAQALPDGSNSKRVRGLTELSAVWDQIGMCSAVGLVAGLWCAFGIYASALKANGGFDAMGAATLGIVLNLGSFLSGPFVGEVHDRIGPKWSCAVAALLGGLGYSMVAGAVAQPAGSVTNSVAYLSVAFFMVGVSSPLAYVGAMYTATTILSVQMRPIAVLVVGVPNQLGGILAALIFHYGSERFDEFFITLAVITAAVYALGAVVLRAAPLSPPGVAAAMRPDDAADSGVGAGVGLPRLDSTDRADSTGSTGSTDSASARKERSLLARPLWLRHAIEVLWNPHFWYLTGPTSVVIGAALSISNSLSLVVETITDTKDNEYRRVSFNLVTLYLSTAVLCRLVMLWAVYRLPFPYGTYITVCCGLGALGALVLAFRPTDLGAVYAGVALIGMSWGGVWPISTTILRSMFSGSRFGMALGVFGIAPGVTGLVFSYISSGLYDRHADGPQHLCVGDKCYRGWFFVAFAAAVVSMVLSIPLIRRTPKPAAK